MLRKLRSLITNDYDDSRQYKAVHSPFACSRGRFESLEERRMLSVNTLWAEQLGTSSGDSSSSATSDSSGNVYISGSTAGDIDGANAGEADVFISKYNANGSFLWAKQLGTDGNDTSRGISADGLGNVYIAGSTNGDIDGVNAGGHDAFVSKYSDSGTLIWSRQLGTSVSDFGQGVSADGLGNVYISGYTLGNLEGINAGTSDAFVSKYNASGTLLWTKQLGTSDSEVSRNVAADGLGNVYITGYTYGSLEGMNAGGQDAFVSKYDSSGTILWTKQIGSSSHDVSYDVTPDGLGNVYISGETYGDLDGTNAGSSDAFVSKYSTSGTFLWTKQIGTSSVDGSLEVEVDGLGDVYIAGDTYGNLGGTNAGGQDAFASKISADGDLLWTKQIGTGSNDRSNGLAVDTNGNVYMSGDTLGDLGGTNTGDGDVFVVRIAEDTFFVNTTADTVDSSLGDGIAEDSSENTSLRAAIQEANALGVPTAIILPEGNYALNLTGSGNNAGDLDITGDITIVGDGAGLTVIDASSLTNERFFDVFGTLSLSGVTLTGGDVTSGVNGTVGGAIWVRTGGTLDLSESALVDNHAGNVGGAIYNSGTITVSDSVIADNSSVSVGGGIRDIGTATLSNTIVSHNSGSGSGPDVYGSFTSDGSNRLTTITGASGFGSDHVGTVNHVVTSVADRVDSGNDAYEVSLREAVIASNSNSGLETTWLPAWRHRLDLTGSGNNAGDMDITDDITIIGAGAGLTVIDASDLTNERIFDVFDTLNLADVTLTGGDVTSGVNGTVGGAIWVRTGATLDLSESALVDNHAGNVGGAIYSSGTITVADSAITDNSAVSFGGGIRSTGTATLNNTVIANNSGSSSGPDVYGSFTSNGNNMLTDITGASGLGSDYVGTADYVVTSIADRIDAVDDAFALSLREAVIKANSTANTSGDDEIWLAPWLFALTKAGSSEQFAATGDLDVREDLTIRSAGAATIDATQISDDVFEEIGATLTLDTGITVNN